MLSRFLAAEQVTSMGVFIPLQEEPGKMTPHSGSGTTQQRPRLSSLPQGNRPVSLPWQSVPAQPRHQPRRILGSRHPELLASHSHCFGSPTPAVSINSWVSQMEGSPAGECLACA